MTNSYIGKMATILWLQPLWAHRDKIPQYCNSTWKPMSESSSAIKRYGNRYSDKLYPNTCCLFLDAYCVGKHQILRKSSNFHKIPLVNHWIFRKISYLCPRIEAFFAYCKIQKRAEVRSFPYCYLYYIGKRPTSWFSIKVQFRASYFGKLQRCRPLAYRQVLMDLQGMPRTQRSLESSLRLRWRSFCSC